MNAFSKFIFQTYNVDRQVPDSAGTATAYLCGTKGNFATLGVNAKINSHDPYDCDTIKKNSVPSIMTWAEQEGKYD